MKVKLQVLKEINPNQSYKLTENIEYSKKQCFLKELAEDYDGFGRLEYLVGKELEEVYNNNNYRVGLHFTGYSEANEDFLNNVFQDGLINNQDAMQGIESPNIDIEKTVSFVDNFTIFIGQLKSAHSYKESQGAFLIKIPKKYIDDTIPESERQPIYRKGNSDIHYLLPEFIYGFIPVDEEGNIKSIIKNPGYKDIHTNTNDTNLIYEGQVLGDNRIFEEIQTLLEHRSFK